MPFKLVQLIISTVIHVCILKIKSHIKGDKTLEFEGGLNILNAFNFLLLGAGTLDIIICGSIKMRYVYKKREVKF